MTMYLIDYFGQKIIATELYHKIELGNDMRTNSVYQIIYKIDDNIDVTDRNLTFHIERNVKILKKLSFIESIQQIKKIIPEEFV